METKISKGELSGELVQHQESTIISSELSEWEEELIKQKNLQNKTVLIKSLGGLRAFEMFTPERFVISAYNSKALDAVNSWDVKKENLYLFGPVGCGKSHLQAMAVRKNIESNPWRGSIKKIHTICRDIRSCQDASGEACIIDAYSKQEIFGIDDLGVEKHTEFVLGIIYEIIDARYMNKPGGLIITSNLSLSELAQKLGDDRIPSRIAQMCKVFGLIGEKDWRIK